MNFTKAKVQAYIEKSKDKKFSWGSNDCYTFTKDIINIIWPDNKLKDVFASIQYNSLTQAKQLQIKHSWRESLCEVFITRQIFSAQDIQDLDIVIIRERGFECMHIYLDNCIYSMSPGLGLVKLSTGHLEVLECVDFTIIRLIDYRV